MAQTEKRPLQLGSARINVSEATVGLNLMANIRRPLPQAQVGQSEAKRIVLVAGGPFLDESLENIRELMFKGTPIMAMNGTTGYLVSNGIRPNYVIHCDAREVNLGFFEEAVPGCRYFVASHCAPTVFERLQDLRADVWLYHTVPGEGFDEILHGYYGENGWFRVNAGNTVGLVAIGLARMIGYPFMTLFGYDSCCEKNSLTGEFYKHAYPQPIDEDDQIMEIEYAGRQFYCTHWQMKQAENFSNLLIHFGQYFSLSIAGDGLLAYILEAGVQFHGVEGDSDAVHEH